jgi:hypothetical protein
MTLDELLVDMNACVEARVLFRGMTPDAAYRYIARYIPHDGYGDAGRFGDTPDDWIFWFAGTVVLAFVRSGTTIPVHIGRVVVVVGRTRNAGIDVLGLDDGVSQVRRVVVIIDVVAAGLLIASAWGLVSLMILVGDVLGMRGQMR